MSGNSVWFIERSNKRRKYNGLQSQIQYPINLDARPPQGPRGKYSKPARKYFAPRRIKHDVMERSTSRDHLQSLWRTSSEGTSSSTLLTEQVEHNGMERSTSRDHLQSPGTTSSEGTSSSTFLTEQSECFQNEGANGNQGYCQLQNLEINSQSHYPSIEPEIEQSTKDRTNNDDDKDDDKDNVVDLYDTAPLEAPLPIIDPTVPNCGIEQDDDHSNDAVMVTDDALHETEIPMDNLPDPTIGDQENDQDWESNYAVEDRATKELSALQSTPQLAAANAGTSDSVTFIAHDSMADVTANPWTT